MAENESEHNLNLQERITQLELENIILKKQIADITPNLDLFRIIEEYSTDVIGVYDKNFVPQYISPSCIKYSGYSAEELIKKSAFELIHPDDIERFQSEILTSISNKSTLYTNVYRIKHADGHYLWNESKSHPKYVDGELHCIIVNSRDISDRKAIEDALIEAQHKAEESDKLKSAFLANMSHEIRTPMNGIIGFSEMILEPNISDEKKSYFAKIVIDSGKQLLTVVNDILDISQIETGQMQLVNEQLNLNGLLMDLFAFFKPQLANKTIFLFPTKQLDDDRSYIVADGVRLRQILTNLINNAIKFTHIGHVKYGYEITDSNLLFYIEDTGIGISKDNIDSIFERFRQEEIGTSRNYGGTGLGLSISQKLVQLMGGTMWVESLKGVGSTFYFTIPYIPVEVSDDFVKKAPNNYTILVADDEEINMLMISELLSKKGNNLLFAKNGLEAVELCRSNSIDLILMDIKMPYMDGYTALDEIRKFNTSVRVIAQTAYAMASDRDKALDAGFDAYISKPIKRDELFMLIDTYKNAKI